MLRRYVIKCHDCDGSGLLKSMDEDGNHVLESCICYRGHVIIRLSTDDELKLHRDLECALRENHEILV